MTTKSLLLAGVFCFFFTTTYSQVAITTDGTAADAGAMLHIKSINKGLLIPRMTLLQRGTISPVPEGLLIFQQDNTPGFYYNASSIPAIPNWKQLITTTDQYWFKSGNDIYLNATVTGNVGIGSISPTQGGLVVDRKAGAVNAMFGSNTTGIAIESSYPGIAFNTYFNSGRKFIANGYGGLLGLNPDNGNLSLWVSPSTGTTGNAAALNEAMTIKPNGRVGFNNSNPTYPVTLNASSDGFVQINPTSNISMGTYVGSDGGWLQTLTNHPLYFTTNNGQPAMTLGTNGKFAVGTTPDADAMLTVMNSGEGLKQTNATVEVGTYLTASSGSIRTFTNHPLRFGANNRDGDLNVLTNGNVSIGVQSGTAKLTVSAVSTTGLEVTSEALALKAIGSNGGTALEIAGAIKVSGSDKAAFILSASAANMYTNGGIGIPTGPTTSFAQYIKIDNALCNNDPNALIFVTSRSYLRTFVLRYYNNAWYIFFNRALPDGSSTFYAPSCQACSSIERSVMDGFVSYLQVGEEFNVMIIKQ